MRAAKKGTGRASRSPGAVLPNWSTGRVSDPRVQVLQTCALTLRHRCLRAGTVDRGIVERTVLVAAAAFS